MEQYLQDFKLTNQVPSKIFDKYSQYIPSEIVDFWRNYGFGTFMEGYFKSVNPDDYKDIVVKSSQRYRNSIVLFATGMGDLVIWSEGYVRLLNFRHGEVKTIMYTFEFFFQNVADLQFKEEDLSWQP